MARKTTNRNTAQREWLWRTLIAGLFATAGFVAKDLYIDWRATQAHQRAAAEVNVGALRELATLLDESYRIYTMQNDQAQRLLRLLERNHRRQLPEGSGYDETFHALH